MDKLILNADKREVVGKKVKRLREAGFLPANLFGKKIKSQAVTINLAEFLKVYQKAGETSLINIQVKGDASEKAVLVTNIQVDPIHDLPIHVDFHQVDLKEKVTAKVPVEIEGESPAEKTGVGTVVQQLDEIEVEALPQDLPEKFIVDAAKLEEVDQAVYVKDLKYDKNKVEVVTDLESIVVKVEPPQKEEVVEPTPSEEAPVAEGEAAPASEAEAPKTEESKEEPTAKK